MRAHQLGQLAEQPAAPGVHRHFERIHNLLTRYVFPSVPLNSSLKPTCWREPWVVEQRVLFSNSSAASDAKSVRPRKDDISRAFAECMHCPSGRERCPLRRVVPAQHRSLCLGSCRGTLSGLLIGRDANGRRVGRRCLSPAPQGSRSSGREAVRPARDDVGDLLKLVRCEVGRDLVNRSGFGYQKHGCRDRG